MTISASLILRIIKFFAQFPQNKAWQEILKINELFFSYEKEWLECHFFQKPLLCNEVTQNICISVQKFEQKSQTQNMEQHAGFLSFFLSFLSFFLSFCYACFFVCLFLSLILCSFFHSFFLLCLFVCLFVCLLVSFFSFLLKIFHFHTIDYEKCKHLTTSLSSEFVFVTS